VTAPDPRPAEGPDRDAEAWREGHDFTLWPHSGRVTSERPACPHPDHDAAAGRWPAPLPPTEHDRRYWKAISDTALLPTLPAPGGGEGLRKRVEALHAPKAGAFGMTICAQECRDAEGSTVPHPCSTAALARDAAEAGEGA
jgi:hypothetical protein